MCKILSAQQMPRHIPCLPRLRRMKPLRLCKNFAMNIIGALVTERRDDPTAFIKYMLGTIIAAYRDFEDRINIVGTSSFDTVSNAVQSKTGKFTKRDISEVCPAVSASTVERHLKKLCADGIISKGGGGRSTSARCLPPRPRFFFIIPA